MAHQSFHGIVVERARKAIHVVRIVGEPLETWEIDHVAAAMRERLLSRTGEQEADVVVIQGETRETLSLFGHPQSVSRVRAALFNAAVSWSPVTLG